MKYDIVIGLEVHTQLATNSKLFCSCSTKFTNEPNVNICTVCTGQLGALPVLNKKVMNYAIKAGLSLNCKINNFSMFDRKNYFYPDLPKGYQISQFYHPYAEYGHLDISVKDTEKRVNITRIHIEEDAGKMIHDEMRNRSYVDMNRCSVPLIEIVSEPDISSSEEAIAYLSKLRTILKYTEVSDVSMDLGSFRCDANVSIKPEGSTTLGTRTEIKNLNSFKAISKAIDYEVSRQKELLSEGKEIHMETRLWDEARMVTRSMRKKEDAQDYRYFPDGDLLPVIVSNEQIEEIRNDLPEFPEKKEERFVSEYGIPKYDASVLVTDKLLANYFEDVVNTSKNPKSSSNWIMVEVMRILDGKNDISTFPISSKHLGKMIKMIDDNIISGKIAKSLFKIMLEDKSNRDPEVIVKEENMGQLSDESAIEKIVDGILEKNPESIKDFNDGKDRALGFLVGQVMKQCQGKANPGIVNKLILSKIKK